MALKFNVFTGNFDQTGSGGGGSAFFTGEVATYADLPLDGTAPLDSRWLVRTNSGTWPFSSYKQAGVYVRSAVVGASRDNDYTLTDTSFHDVMSDDAFLLFDEGDATKNLKFQLSGIATATTRTITMPDANVTLPDQGTSTGDSPTFAQVTINDTPNDVSTLTLANDNGANKIEFEAQELTLRHTGTNDTPYINVTDGTDYALLGVRQGDMFLQGSNAVVRIEQALGALADIKVNKLVLEDATTAGDPTATFDADGNLTANRTYDLPNASGTLALTAQLTDTQIFTANGTWTKPAGAKMVHAFLVGGGAGGGSGRRSASADNAGGGGGGGGAGMWVGWMEAATLGSTETVTVGAGGAGGANRNNDTNGLNGTGGGNTSFGAIIGGGSGGVGVGGTNTAGGTGGGAGGGDNVVMYGTSSSRSSGGAGGFSANASAATARIFFPGGGGGGGGKQGATYYVGGAGSNIGTTAFNAAGGAAAASTAGSNAAASFNVVGTGASGGSPDSSTGAGNVGGNGIVGSGGGGGSAALNDAGGSTAGGNGGNGIVVVTTYF